MRKLGVVLIILFFACEGDNRPPKPDDLIAKKEMVDLLYDIQIINSAKSVNKHLLENQGVDPEDYIFNKYKIDSSRFARSNAYYAYDTDTYEKILDEVENRLDSMEQYYNDLYNQEEIEKKRKRDSAGNMRDKVRDSVIEARKSKPIDSVSFDKEEVKSYP